MTISIWNEYPDQGHWERNTAHFPTGMSLHLWDLFMPAHHKGSQIGFQRYGSAINRFDFARFRGRVYIRKCFINDPAELSARGSIAQEAVTAKLWRRDRALWERVKTAFRTRLLEFARQDVANMSPDDLLHRLTALRQIFTEGVIQHFSQQPASMFAVGDWVRNVCAWTGAGTFEALAILRNSSEESGDSLLAIRKIADIINGNNTAASLLRDSILEPPVRLEQLRQVSSQIDTAIGSYLNEYGDRIVTGFDVTDLTLRELPHMIVALLSSHTGLSNDGARELTFSDVEHRLRSRVPIANKSLFDVGLEEAKCAYGLSDEDVRLTYLWPLGLLRRTMQVASEQLVRRGAMHSADDIFQTTPAELDALLSGRSSPTADELSRRTREYSTWALEEPPSSFGEPESISEVLLNPECARVTAAICFYLAEMERAGTAPSETASSPAIEGLAASPGRYEGRARVVHGPGDFEKVKPGDVLVARTTSPACNLILPVIGGVVTDRGGALCHAAIIAREFGIPAVVGTNLATTRIPDGAHVLVDGDRGFVTVRR